MSSMEYKMKQVLDDIKIEYMYNSTHNNLKSSKGRLRFDFIIPTINESFFMIELNGIQHYLPQRFGGTTDERANENFERQVLHDELKRRYCEDNGYPLLIIKYDEDREYKQILEEFILENELQV